MLSLGGSTLPPPVPGWNSRFNFTHHLGRIFAVISKSSENLGLISPDFLQQVFLYTDYRTVLLKILGFCEHYQFYACMHILWYFIFHIFHIPYFIPYSIFYGIFFQKYQFNSPVKPLSPVVTLWYKI